MDVSGAKVYLIGAGPGDPGLISVKGREILYQCDTVIYDALVNDILIAPLPERIHRIYAGKRGGKQSTSQASINRLLLREALKGRKVARLKGGDPLLLGRGSEEMEYLKTHGIPFEIIPGISSALAAPAWAGIPVTHRNISRSVAIVTGHLKAGERIEKLELPSADTLVILMAMQNLSILVEKLLSQKRFTKDTPAAIICNGTLPDQKVISGTLENIVQLKERFNLKPPAAIVVGKTAQFAETLNWYSRPLLAGRRVVVLRIPEQSDSLAEALYKEGASVVCWPIIKIRPRKDVLNRLNSGDFQSFTSLIFTSPNAVRIYMDALLKQRIDIRNFYGKKVYAIGEGTAKALFAYGIIADGVPQKYVAEGILQMMPSNLRGEKILIPRASKARELLPLSLKKRGAEVKVLSLYDTVKGDVKHCPVEDGDYVIFTSSSIATAFFEHSECTNKKIIPCCIGDITADTVRKYFKGEMHIAKNATVSSLIDALKDAVNLINIYPK